MKIEEYLETLPENVLNGENVQLSEKSLRDIFKIVNLGKNDIFYHLGCSDEKGIEIAINEFEVKRAVGIDNNCKKIQEAKKKLKYKKNSGELICQDIQESDLSSASVILFWFSNDLVLGLFLGG